MPAKARGRDTEMNSDQYTGLGRMERFKDMAGSLVDAVFLSVPKIAKPFRPPRKISRAEYERQVDFYIDSGYADQAGIFLHISIFHADMVDHREASRTMKGRASSFGTRAGMRLKIRPCARDTGPSQQTGAAIWSDGPTATGGAKRSCATTATCWESRDRRERCSG